MSYNSKVFKFSKRKYDIFWPTLWRIFVFIGIVWGRVHSHLLDINLICVDSGNIERNIQLKGKYCLSIAYSPTGTHLAAGGLNGMINICDIQTGQVKSIDGHAMPVRSLAFSHDGQKLVSVSDDGQIKFFEVLVFCIN